jgi:DNA-binding NtrC family response regulator
MAATTIRDRAGAGDPSARQFLLVLGPEHSETRPLPATGRLSIGRGEEADVRIVDALASRAHALLHLGQVLQLEDLGSFNGTHLRDRRLRPHERVEVTPGEAITIGTTILVVQRRPPSTRPRPIRPHGYFETRLIEACAQAVSARSELAVVRLHLDGPDDRRERAEAALLEALRPGDVLARYGPPGEYEVLLVDTDRAKSRALSAEMVRRLDQDAVAARAGVACFPEDGTSPEVLIARACDRVRGDRGRAPDPAVVLKNRAMRDLFSLTEKAARGTINVLILGETGAGKEILAQAVHRMSPRASGPFVCLNCAALSDSLLESELFGHEKGAFTGALATKVGLLEAASSGTLFLDEIGEMSLAVQAKVLRALETREVMRVGSTRALPVDVRFVAATNRDLEEEVAAGRFREDLYFRLGGITLTIPPLRDRTDEIPALARLFLETAAAQAGLPVPRLSPEALGLLGAYAWPGNIRELRNVVERALLLASGGAGIIGAEHLPVEKLRGTGRRPPTTVVAPAPAPLEPRSMVEIEKQAMLDALDRCAGNQTRAAELLGMPRRTFCKKLNEHRIPRPRV